MYAAITRDKAVLILEWFEDRFGRSKYCRTFPKIRVYRSRGTADYPYRKDGTRGSYSWDRKTIAVFLGTIQSVKVLCESIAHEYKHYLMDSKEYDRLEKALKRENLDIYETHRRHPHERACDRFEERWGPVCYGELKNRLYS